jgi:hypothetical protein
VAGLGVKADCRFVENKQVGIVDKSPGKDESSFHPPGEFLYRDITFFLKLDKLEKVVGFLFCTIGGDIEIPGIIKEVAKTGEVRIEICLLRDYAEPLFDFSRVEIRVHAKDPD